jgi:putative ABC transport system substrate-binding protein
MRRRDFLTVLGSAAAAWPLASLAQAQQQAPPVVGFVSGSSREAGAERAAAFRRGLGESGFVEGRNVTVEYHWMDGQYDQLPSLMSDFVRRSVAVIATAGNPPALAARAATATLPIVFGVGEDPVKLGLVASLARPGGNATGMNFLATEIATKQLGLLREVMPKASRISVLVNPTNASNAESTVQDLPTAARALGLQIEVLSASTGREIEAAFAAFAREKTDALFIASEPFFVSRRVQIATLAAHYTIPTILGTREFVEAGGFMSYAADILEMYRRAGDYTARILKGTKPADLPVTQPSKFDLVINLQTARLLGIDVPPQLIAIADEVIEP